MARNIAVVVRDNTQLSSLSSLVFMCLMMTATLAVVSALCGTRCRRKNKGADQPDAHPAASSSSPPDAARRLLGGNGSQSMRPASEAAANRLSSVSMGAGRSLSMSMRWSRKDAAGQKMKAKLEKEDSVWMKTIILGEKCRVDDEDDAVIFDQRGVKVTAYHPKVPSSLPVSRTSSYIDPTDAVPGRASSVIHEKDRINEI